MTRVLLSYGYPPFEAPRAVQVERLARHLPEPIEVFCGEVERISAPDSLRRRGDLEGHEGHTQTSLGGPMKAGALQVIRVPWGRRAQVRRALHARLLRNRVDIPDRYRPWAANAVRALLSRSWHENDVLVTFGQPWSDHLVGLRVVARTGTPWVAHFSDPWVDNPLATASLALRIQNARLERAVVERADRLVFTNEQALALVMEKYPPEWRAKTRVVPHAFDPRDHPAPSIRQHGEPIVARYLGRFYGHRSPRPLFGALARLACERPDAIEGLCVELVGTSDVPLELGDLPRGLVRLRPPVDHQASLELMAASDLLLVVDAPAARSPFLPSKLVEYLGSGRPIAALSPPGPSADLVRRLGGWVADPASSRAAAAVLVDALEFARKADGAPWGDPEVRAEYRADRVAAAFEAILTEAVAPPNGRDVASRLTPPEVV